jgi:hypothetical protein
MERDVRDDEIRVALQKKLRRPVPDELWSRLVEEGYVEDARLVPDVGLQDMAEAARRYRTHYRPVSADTTVRPVVEAAALARAGATSTYLAALAADQPRVRRFRREVLAGMLVRPVASPSPRASRRRMGPTQEEEPLVVLRPDGRTATSGEIKRADRTTLGHADAWALVESAAPCFLSRARFQALGVPVVGHGLVVRRTWREMGGERKGTSAERGKSAQQGWWREMVEVETTGEGGGRKAEFGLTQCVLWPEGPGPRPLHLPTRDGRPLVRSVWPSAVFDELRVLSEWLAGRYPWTVPGAAWFVLTGDPPALDPLGVSVHLSQQLDHTYARVTLSVEPWMPEGAVARAYRELKRDMMPRKSHATGTKTMEILAFVADRMRRGRQPNWQNLALEWDRSHPDDQFGDRARHFHTYWKRALKSLFPIYAIPATEDGLSTEEEPAAQGDPT